MAKKEQLLRLVHIVKALEKAPEEGFSYQELYDYLKQKHEDKTNLAPRERRRCDTSCL